MTREKLGGTDTEQAQSADAPGIFAPLPALGAVTSILLASPMHRHVFLNELEWMVVPAIGLGQCRIFHHQGVPVAFATWALLGEEAAERFVQGHGRLKPEEWHSGDQLWLVELCAPYGGVSEHISDLLNSTFKGRTVKTMRPRADGQGVEQSTLDAMLAEMSKVRF